ncbi:hypothetical protein DJ021_13275 [Phenylobacterium hankyongense]|uniref:Putative Flp pilus-assembly TadG-like N-terminal domain-containing protein n=1 Tax=Phenylobacterium hankyongense TaxID=1813876 RepID=A0A328B011_9CAUL|nr:pilus assembly protein TadG-related protein [Phenylobacterium hankyongense]RAK60710.1 hypothetical protein DJ021_13275 [Phenylobacterium hankyongense]
MPHSSSSSQILRALGDDRSGASAVIVGLSMVTVLGFVGLGIDVGASYVARRSAQNAADSAAFSAAAAVMAGTSNVTDQARAVAAAYGLRDGVDGVQVTVNTPPATGGQAGNAKAVEVIIARPGRRFFSVPFARAGGVIRARAVARYGAVGNACVVALNSTASASALETGSTDVKLVGCSLYANSTSSTALQLKGAATITADSVGLVGGYSLSNNAALNTTNGVHTGQAAIADPYKDVPLPAYSGCDFTGGSLPSGVYSNTGGRPLVFCNGLSISSGATVTLNPGTYIIDRGDLTVNGGATLKGQGVTLVFTSSTGSNYSTLHINGNATIDLSAPTSGPTQGMALYQDRRAPGGVENVFNGGSTQRIQGAIYFPSQKVTFSGGSSTTTPGCTQLLASEVAFKGNASLGINCAGTGVRMAGGAAPALVE